MPIDFVEESQTPGTIDFVPEEESSTPVPPPQAAQPQIPLPPSSMEQVAVQNIQANQQVPQFRGILPPNPESLKPSNLSPWQKLRYSRVGHTLFGPTEEEQQSAIGVPFGDPGIVPIAMTAPFPFLPGAESKAGRVLLGGFIAKFLKDAPDAYKGFDAALKRKDYQEARRIAIDFGFGAAFNALAAKGLFEHYAGPQAAPATTGREAAPAVPADETPPPHVEEPKAKVRVDKNEDGSFQVSAELPGGESMTEDHPTAQAAGERAQQLEKEGFTAKTPDADYTEELTDEEAAAHEPEPVAQEETQPDLATPEGMEDYANEVAKRHGHAISLEEPGKPGENQPFASQTGGYFFRAFGGNKIGMRREQFQKWIQSVPPELRRQAIESRVNEETIHNEVIDSLGGIEKANEKMGEYWDTLTAVEKGINRRRYTGQWGVGEHTPDQLGHEAVRFRLQRARGMTPSEFAETARTEKWTLKSLTALEDMVRGVREKMGTKAAKANVQIMGDLDTALKNIQAAKPVAKQNDEVRYPEGATREVDEYLKDIRAGNRLTTGEANKAGMKARTIEDLEALKQERLSAGAEMKKAMAAKDYDGAARASRTVQFPREAIETAVDAGSNSRENQKNMGTNQEERPMDWRKNPEVAQWLKENAKQLGIVLPDDFKAPEPVYPEGSPRKRKKESEIGMREGDLPFGQRTASDVEKERQTKEGETLQRPGGQQIESKASDIIAGEIKKTGAESYSTPTFSEFEDWAKRNVGNIGATQLKDLWQDTVWNHLMNASGERLEEWRKALGMENKYGARQMADKPAEGQSQKDFELEQQSLQGKQKAANSLRKQAEKLEGVLDRLPSIVKDKAQRDQIEKGFSAQIDKLRAEADSVSTEKREERLSAAENKKTAQSRQNYRNMLIADIGLRLSQESRPKADIDRKTVGMDDIDFGNPNSTEGSYRQFSQKESENPETLSTILRDEARTKGEPLSNTKRLVAVVDKHTGQVSLVSTYWDGAAQKIVDPALSGVTARPHVNLDANFLRRYRPMDSILLEEPVRGFHQRFETVSEYNDKIRNGAEAMAQQGDHPIAGEAKQPEEISDDELERRYTEAEMMSQEEADRAGITRDVEPGTPGLPSEAGTISGGPGGVEASAGLGKGVGVLERGGTTPITPREVRSLWDAFHTQEINSPEQFEELVGKLSEKSRSVGEGGKRTRLTGRELQFVSALDKIVGDTFRELRRHAPDNATIDNAIKIALSNIYENIQGSETYSDFLLDTLQTHGGERQGSPEKAPAPETSQELTALSRVPPTVTRGPGGERIYSQGPRLPQEAGRVPVVPPEMLSQPREGQGAYEPTTRSIFPELPTTPGNVGGPRFKGEAPPGAFRSAPKELPHEAAVGERPTPKTPLRASQMRERARYQEWLRQAMSTSQRYPEGSPRALKDIKDTFDVLKDYIKGGILRSGSKEDLYKARDVADVTAGRRARNYGAYVRATSMKDLPKTVGKLDRMVKWTLGKNVRESEAVRRAAKAVIATGEISTINTGGRKVKSWAPDRAKLPALIQKVDNAIQYAEAYASKRDPRQRIIGRKWLEAAQELRKELEYAQTNWNDPRLKATVKSVRNSMREQWDWERQNGFNGVKFEKNYVPGRYRQDVWNGNEVIFPAPAMGKGFWKAKSFNSAYDAIEQGPYIPFNYDTANLVEHRVRQGSRLVNKNIWTENLKSMKDPVTGDVLALEPVKKKGSLVSPDPENYKMVTFDNGRKALAIHKAYSSTVRNAAAEFSVLSELPVTKHMMQMGAFLKHNGILIYDTYHPNRLMEYNLALTGRPGGKLGVRSSGYGGGWATLEFREADLQKAVQAGLVTPDEAAWGSKTADVNFGGQKVKMNYRELLDLGIEEGANIGKLQDALYGEVRHFIPGLHRMNRFIFDRMTRGIMAEGIVYNFLKYNEKLPNTPVRTLMRDVAKDFNFFYGSIGRQGFFKHPFMRELNQLALLAPEWVEGLAQKEARFYSRATGLSRLTGRGKELPAMGSLGSGMAKGLAFFFIVGQMINLFTKNKPTWKNEEEGHKGDAWIPLGHKEGQGFWMNFGSVFAELSHDALRLMESKPTAWEAVEQVGYNKLGPWGRMAAVMASKKTPTGQYIPTTGGRIAESAKQLLPVPVTLGKPVQWGLNKLAPGMVAPPKPYSTGQQLVASLSGVKVQTGESAQEQIYKMADHFKKENNIRQGGPKITPTTDPSYQKLRSAARRQDSAGMEAQFKELRKTRSEDQIVKQMTIQARRPFTGGNDSEAQFMNWMDDRQMDLYHKAQQERLEELSVFLDWLSTSR